jgi:hypothetical protein
MGVWERINIFAYPLWVAVLAITLLSVKPQSHFSSSRASTKDP